MSEMRGKIMEQARAVVQQRGYNGLSFRELAKSVGVKSSSIHHYFPTKADLGAALAQDYSQEAHSLFESFIQDISDPNSWLIYYTNVFRRALEESNKMCLCGIMGADYADLPEKVRIEVKSFADMNVAWLTKVLSMVDYNDGLSEEERAEVIYAAVIGAQLVARSRNDITLFDRIVNSYRAIGVIPK